MQAFRKEKKKMVQYIRNILLFILYGFRFPWKDNLKCVFATALILSVFLELSQFVFIFAWCEVDYVISNTLGAMLRFGV